MTETSRLGTNLSPQQQAIRDKCFHPSGDFVEFRNEDVERSIPDRFEKIVRLFPNRLAVKIGDRALTYEELDRAANRIAHGILEKHGEGSEPIALLFEHGVDVIAAILGTLKAAKFYIVLDPSFPLARISYMLDDSQAGLIVVNKRTKELANKLSNDARTLLSVDEIDESLGYDNVNLPISADNLGSILYTSGSTGKPKGVAHSHRSQLHTVMVNTNETRICCQDRLTLLHSVGFGSAQAHLFQSLLNGASLCSFDLKSEGIRRLANWLNEESITVFHSPPAVFRQLAELIPVQEKLSGLRLIRLSGAAVTCLDYALYKKTFVPGALLQVVMNSTEANVICSFLTDGSYSFPERGSPAGYPVTGKTIFLLDKDGRQVAPGEAGEIAVRSAYLPLGYWADPDLVGIQIGADPRSGRERTILTGDVARMLPDGLLIYLGRKDSMVKIRGYRVDLAETERALQDHPEIKETGVVAWEYERGEKSIVGYVVPYNQPFPRVDELNAYLRAKLPDYMIPTAYVFLDALPLINGKLDRMALPKPERIRPEVSQPYVSPRSEVEQELVWMWEEVLDVRPIGIHDNFFDLGGHSLAATRLISRVIREFHLELPIKALFESPTVAAMFTVIMQNQENRAGRGDLERILSKVEAMSDEEAERVLKNLSGKAEQ